MKYKLYIQLVMATIEHNQHLLSGRDRMKKALKHHLLEQLTTYALLRHEETNERTTKYYNITVNEKDFQPSDLVLKKVNVVAFHNALDQLELMWDDPKVIKNKLNLMRITYRLTWEKTYQ